MLGLLAGALCTTSVATASAGAPHREAAVASVIAEPGRIVRPGTPVHVYNTPPPSPRPAPAKPKATVGVMSTTASTSPSHPVYNWLRAEDGSISVAVGIYSDPTGSAAVPEGEAVLDTAMRDVPWYFDGHNPGVFTPLLNEGVGSYFDYWDGSGREHRFKIVAVRSWYRLNGEPPPVTPLVVAQFQTCKTLDGSYDWIYDLVAA